MRWITALPAYFGAVNGVTADGTPTGNLLFTIVCVPLATLSVLAAGFSMCDRDLAEARQPQGASAD